MATQPWGDDAEGAISRASDLASTPIVAVEAVADAMSALQEMYRNSVHHLAVRFETEPMGLVAAIDLLFGLAARIPGETVRVDRLCRRPAPRIDVADTVQDAAHTMIEARTDALLVMHGGHAEGVLTAVDIVRSIAEDASRSRTDS